MSDHSSYSDLFDSQDSSDNHDYKGELPWWAESVSSRPHKHFKVSPPPWGKGRVMTDLKTAEFLVDALNVAIGSAEDPPIKFKRIRKSLQETLETFEFNVALSLAKRVLDDPTYFRNDLEDKRWRYIELFHPFTQDYETIRRAYLILTGPKIEPGPIQDDSEEDGSGFVYLAATEHGDYKIGRSQNPDDRISHFDTKMPIDVRRVHIFPADNADEAESILHEWCDDHRVKGEWFDLSDRHVDVIKSIAEYENGDFIRGKDGNRFNEHLETILG